jgi:hypothetical protein
MTTKREPFKIVELAGKKWRIGRFDALTGSYIAFTVMTKMLPMIAELMGGKAETPDVNALAAGMMSSRASMSKAETPDVNALAAGMMSSRASMSKADFLSLQKDCLSVCHEMQMAGTVEAPVAVMMESGAWGVADLEYDVGTVLALTVHALFFNVSSFFEEATLKGFANVAQGLNFSSAKE